VRATLDALNRERYESMRCAIRSGAGSYSWRPSADAASIKGSGYDWLDEVASGILALAEPDAETTAPDAEMVFYQPTPARHVFDLLDRAALDEEDVLVDLGSGLGHVVLLTAIFCAARSVGIEWQPAYVDTARRSAADLNLSRATFVHSDVRSADLSSGTVFYLYTPFTGAILRDVLAALRKESTRRAIRLCTFGPCTQALAAQTWLRPSAPLADDRIAIFTVRP
jgi:hypothetical protein